MNTYDLTQVILRVLRKQHLTEDSKSDDILQIVKDIGGLHATSAITPYLSLVARTCRFSRKALDEERYVKRRLGKIRCMRRTLFILTKEMIPIAHAATRKRVETTSQRYLEFRGVSSEQYEGVSQSILALLEQGEMTASELKKKLTTPLNLSPVLNLMCDQGILIRGQPAKGWKGSQHKYAPFRDYFPDIVFAQLSEAKAITLLVLQYLQSFGPVTETDVVWWTGLTKTQIRRALAHLSPQIIQIEISNLTGNFFMLRSDHSFLEQITLPNEINVNFLPTLDPYLMGYKERDRYLAREHYDYIFDRSGNATSTILVDGRVVGVWDFAEDPTTVVKLFLFNEVENKGLRKINAEAAKVGEFLAETPVQVKECPSMIPIPQRTAGGVMSPLKDC